MIAYDTVENTIRAYEAGDLARDELIELLVTFPYKAPSYRRTERENPPRTDGEMWIAIDSRVYDEPNTWGEVTKASDVGRIPDDVYFEIIRRREATWSAR